MVDEHEDSPSSTGAFRRLIEDIYGATASRSRAIEKALQEIQQSPHLAEQAILYAVQVGLRMARMKQRTQIAQTAEAAPLLENGTATPPPTPRNRRYVDEQTQAQMQSRPLHLLLWPLSTGKLLKNATKEEIQADAQVYLRQGATLLHRGRFLGLLADSLEPGQKPSQIRMTEKDCLKFWQRAHREGGR